MMNMMQTMMNEGMDFMTSGMILSAMLWLFGLLALIWVLLTWLKRQWSRPQLMSGALSPSSASPHYEQGYHPAQPLPSNDGEENRSWQAKLPFDQPFASYPQEQEMPPQF